jgi:gliding motility-associated-like protein
MKKSYKEIFDNYEPEPPKKVWENIEKNINKNSGFTNFKKGALLSGVAIIIIATIFLIIPSKTNISDKKTDTYSENKIITANQSEESNSKEINTYDVTINKKQTKKDINRITENKPIQTESKIKEIIQKTEEKNSLNKNQKNTNTVLSENGNNVISNLSVDIPIENPVPIAQNKESKIKISGEQTICLGEKAILSAEGGVKYLWSTGEKSKSIVVSPNTTTDYTVMVTDEDGNKKTGLLTVTVADCIALFVPNAFTPNGDGQHDVFKPVGTNIKKFEMTILSRTGQIVFNTHSLNDGWDGTIGGKPAPTGVYIYNISYTNELNQNKILQGSLTLIR